MTVRGRVTVARPAREPAVAALAAGQRGHCAAVQHELNMLADAPVMLAVCDAFDIASINRGPLAVGLLTGKGPRRLPAARRGRPRAGRAILAGVPHRRAPGTGAARPARRHPRGAHQRRADAGPGCAGLAAGPQPTVPIPGIRTVAQAEQNAAALWLGPLPATAMAEIARLPGGLSPARLRPPRRSGRRPQPGLAAAHGKRRDVSHERHLLVGPGARSDRLHHRTCAITNAPA